MTRELLKPQPSGGRRGSLLLFVAVGLLAVGGSRDAVPSDAGGAGGRHRTQRVACPECEGECVYESRRPVAGRHPQPDPPARRRGPPQRRRDRRRAGGASTVSGCSCCPRVGGINTLVWALPVAAAVAGGPGLVLVFRKWRREAAATADPTDEDRELVAAALAGEDESSRDRWLRWPSAPVEPRPPRPARGRAVVPPRLAARSRGRARRRRRRRARLRHPARRLHEACGRRAPADRRRQGRAGAEAAAQLATAARGDRRRRRRHRRSGLGGWRPGRRAAHARPGDHGRAVPARRRHGSARRGPGAARADAFADAQARYQRVLERRSRQRRGADLPRLVAGQVGRGQQRRGHVAERPRRRRGRSSPPPSSSTPATPTRTASWRDRRRPRRRRRRRPAGGDSAAWPSIRPPMPGVEVVAGLDAVHPSP